MTDWTDNSYEEEYRNKTKDGFESIISHDVNKNNEYEGENNGFIFKKE